MFAAIIGALLLVLLVLYERLGTKDGQLREAREREAEARNALNQESKEPTLSPRSRELLGLIQALQKSLGRRMQPYPMPENLDNAASCLGGLDELSARVRPSARRTTPRVR